MTSFPTTLADLHRDDVRDANSLYANIKALRKSALSIPNRLRSILQDAEFVQQVSRSYGLPLVANERCGSWYIHPADKVGSAYFKSTDGHHGQWDFSLRRLNLQLLPILNQYGGAVVVDSTRRGKSLPDAFSKTVPIWVAVIHRALFPNMPWTHVLQRPPPPAQLGESEISQIDARLDEFVQAFTRLELDLEKLRVQLQKPIQISWAINGYFDAAGRLKNGIPDSSPLEEDHSRSCHQLVLCSASRRVRGAEISEGGYIQGAGDDSEGWSRGLTPGVFWKYQDELLQAPEDRLPTLIPRLSQQEDQDDTGGRETVKLAHATNIQIGTGPRSTSGLFDLVINCHGEDMDGSPTTMNLGCRGGKLGSKDLRGKLHQVKDRVERVLRGNPNGRILITCSSGKDLSVGVVVMILCVFYDDDAGATSLSSLSTFSLNQKTGSLRPVTDVVDVDKHLVKQRLAWITSSKPDANPSRATLQAVNSYLIQRPD